MPSIPPTRALRTVLVVALVVASGCLGGSDDPAPTPTPAPGNGADDGTNTANTPGAAAATPAGPFIAQAPTWTQGMAWTFDAQYRFGQSGTVTVVALETNNGIELGVTDAPAGRVALVAHWPPLGPIRAGDLGMLFHGTVSAVLRFPMQDGTEWTADFRGEQVTYKATEVSGPEGPMFEVVGTASGEQRFAYTYDPAVSWFRRLYYAFPGNADASHRLDLTRFTPSYHGEVVRFDWADAYVGHRLPGDAPTPPIDTVAISGSKETILAAAFHGGDTGVVQVDVLAPDGQRFTAGGPRSSAEETRLALQIMAPASGSWAVDYTTASQQYTAFVELIELTEHGITI